MALIENMAREDLNPVEEARACAALVEELGLSKEEVARRVGRSRSAISNLIRLLDLPDEVLELLESGELSEGHGRALLAAKGNEPAAASPATRSREGWSVRETEKRAKGEEEPPARKPRELASRRGGGDRQGRGRASRGRSATRSGSAPGRRGLTAADPLRRPRRGPRSGRSRCAGQ